MVGVRCIFREIRARLGLGFQGPTRVKKGEKEENNARIKDTKDKTR